MKRFLGIVLAGVLLLGVAAGFTALALRPPAEAEARRARVAALAEAGVEKGDWPGMMWAEVAPGQIRSLGAVGFADIAGARVMTPDTLMPIGSISKVMVGLAGAAAIEDGTLDPDAPLADYLDLDIAWPDPTARSFTHLATHTSGLRDSDVGCEAAGYHFGANVHPMSLESFLSAYLTEGGALYDAGENFATWPPGSRCAYSNIGAGVAALVVADATGEAFATFSDRVLAPLDLSGGWGPLGPFDAPAATLYSRDETGAFGSLPPYGLATWPDGHYTASARDLARLLATIMAGGVFEDVQILDPGLVALLTTPRITGRDGLAAAGDSVGLFWSKETLKYGIWRQTLEGHSGGDPDVFTMMYRKAGTDTGFVVMLNGEPAGARGLIRLVRIINLLADMPPAG